jgi:hypothetical protein
VYGILRPVCVVVCGHFGLLCGGVVAAVVDRTLRDRTAPPVTADAAHAECAPERSTTSFNYVVTIVMIVTRVMGPIATTGSRTVVGW